MENHTLGYCWYPGPKALPVNQTDSGVVFGIFDQVLKRKSIGLITMELQGRGFGANSGTRFSAQRVHQVLGHES